MYIGNYNFLAPQNQTVEYKRDPKELSTTDRLDSSKNSKASTQSNRAKQSDKSSNSDQLNELVIERKLNNQNNCT